MSLATRILNQCRKPSGWFGRFTLRSMNTRHSALTDWGLQHISIRNNDTILDVGCGGGRTIQKLAAIASAGAIYGIDHSEDSVATSIITNKTEVDAGRVHIQQASVSQLPFPDQKFDLVTAVETHYFWPNLLLDMREILRVLLPGGSLIIIAEAYKGGKYDERLKKLAEVGKGMKFAHLSRNELSDLFSNAGFADVQMFEEYEKGWLSGTGKRPQIL
jgi:SAM-dependent methyltransferase